MLFLWLEKVAIYQKNADNFNKTMDDMEIQAKLLTTRLIIQSMSHKLPCIEKKKKIQREKYFQIKRMVVKITKDTM